MAADLAIRQQRSAALIARDRVRGYFAGAGDGKTSHDRCPSANLIAAMPSQLLGEQPDLEVMAGATDLYPAYTQRKGWGEIRHDRCAGRFALC